MLLTGIKGSGKTVTSKQICNRLGLPVIVVPKNFERLTPFLNDIKQNVIVLFDEYEKIFKDEDAILLPLMDGAMSSKYKTKMFKMLFLNHHQASSCFLVDNKFVVRQYQHVATSWKNQISSQVR